MGQAPYRAPQLLKPTFILRLHQARRRICTLLAVCAQSRRGMPPTSAVPAQHAPGPPAVLRLKRPRAAPAPAVLRVCGHGPAAKRPRTAACGLANLSLAPPPPRPPTPPPRRASYRRADLAVPGVRRAIAKGGVVDVASRLLRRGGVGKDGKGVNGLRGGSGIVMLCDGLAMTHETIGDGGRGVPGGSSGLVERSGTATLVENNGCESEVTAKSRGEAVEDFVYDVYLREEDCDEAEAMGGIEAEAADEAVLMAHDMPNVLFWGDEDGAESSDDEPDDAYLEDSEGSVDYPSTPESDAYVREIVEESASSSDIVDEDEDIWQERRAGFGGARMFAVGTSTFGGVVQRGDREADDGFYDGSDDDNDVGAFDGGVDGYRRGTGEDVDDEDDDDDDEDEDD